MMTMSYMVWVPFVAIMCVLCVLGLAPSLAGQKRAYRSGTDTDV